MDCVSRSLKFSTLDPGSRILYPGSRIQEPGSWIQDSGSGSSIQDAGSWTQDAGSSLIQIWSPGPRIQDHPCSRLLDTIGYRQDTGATNISCGFCHVSLNRLVPEGFLLSILKVRADPRPRRFPHRRPAGSSSSGQRLPRPQEPGSPSLGC